MIEKDENLGDLAQLLNVSTAFVSSVLVGKKSIPEEWLNTLSDYYDLNDDESNELFDAYSEVKNTIKIDVSNCPKEKKKLALQFQRKLPDLSEEELNSIIDILNKEDN